MGESSEESGEERFAKVLGKAGAFCGLLTLIVILAVAACAILALMGVEHEILSAIQYYGPGMAAAVGTVSSVSTYYGWFRILRRKKKLSKKEEAKSEAQGQFGDFIQALPEIFKSIGCLPQLVTATLGVSLVASAVTYTPVVEIVKPYVIDLREKIKTYLESAPKPPPSPEKTIEEPPQIKEASGKLTTLIDITGKLYTRETRVLGRGIIGGGGTVELIRDGVVVATTQTNLDGGYAFIGVPAGKYSVRARMDGYRQAEAQIGYDIKMEPEDERLYRQDPFMAGLLELVKILESPDKDFSKDKKSNGTAATPALAILRDSTYLALIALVLGPPPVPDYPTPVLDPPPVAIVVEPPSSVVLPPLIATDIDQPVKSSAGFWSLRNALRVAALGLSATSLGMGIYYNSQADSKSKYLQEYRDAAALTSERNYGEAYKNFNDMKNSVDNTRNLRDGLYIGAGALGVAGAATFVF